MGLVKNRKTISDLLTREDIPTHFRTTLEKLQLSCLSEKLICILSTLLSTLFSMVFHNDTGYGYGCTNIYYQSHYELSI